MDHAFTDRRRVTPPGVRHADVAGAAPPARPVPMQARPASGTARVRTKQVDSGPRTGVGPPALVAALAKIGQRKVPASAASIHALIAEDAYGVTWAESIEVGLAVKLDGDQWVPIVTDLEGQYSIQARLMPHQTDVQDESVADQHNYQTVVAALRALGEPADELAFYSLRAVEAHESRHATRILQALSNTRARIEDDVRATAIPAGSAVDATDAEQQIRASAAFQAVFHPSIDHIEDPQSDNAYRAWFREYVGLADGDHEDDGPCMDAERSVTTPLIAAIEQKAVDQRWDTPPQIDLPQGYQRPAWPPQLH